MREERWEKTKKERRKEERRMKEERITQNEWPSANEKKKCRS